MDISLNNIRQAAERISGIIRRTPVLTSSSINKMCGKNVFLKAENMQKTGSFKIRGASNAILNLIQEPCRNGVVTASSGNHGQAVAHVAARVGLPATVVMPEDASRAKVAACKHYGARVVYCGFRSSDRLAKAKEIGSLEGLTYIPPYDHPHVISGQGTAGLELLEQVPEVNTVLVPIGGGGLISGIATALKESNPRVQVIGVEPEQSNSMYLSRLAGKITALEQIDTVADGLRTRQPGELTFPIVQRYVDDIVLVTEEEIKYAFAFLLERQKTLVEPSGAVTVAAVLNDKVPGQGKNVVCILSGGNVELAVAAKIILGEGR